MAQRVLLYCRQSDTSDQGRESLSLASQETALRERAAREGWAVVGVEVEPDLKGWMDEAQRPAFARALARAEAGDYDTLLVWDSSRFARSVRLQEQWVWQLGRLGVDVVSHTEPHFGDDMIRQILGAVHERQTKIIAGHVRRALRERARQGKPHGIAPIGYHRPEPKGPYAPDDDAPLALEVFERYDTGEGIAALADDLTARGIPTPRGYRVWRLQTVLNVLRNPAYRGAVVLSGETVENAHPAIVPPELWWRVHERLEGRRRAPRRKAHSSWLEGLIVHGCGMPMYLIPPRRKTPSPAFRCRGATTRHIDVPCTVRPTEMAAPKVEAAVWERVIADLDARQSLDQVLAAAEDAARVTTPLAERRRREVEERRRRAELARGRVEELYLSAARDRAWFDTQDALAAAQIAACNAELAALPALPDTAALTRVDAALAELDSLGDLLRRASPAARRDAMTGLGVAVIDAGGVGIRYRAEVAPFFLTLA